MFEESLYNRADELSDRLLAQLENETEYVVAAALTVTLDTYFSNYEDEEAAGIAKHLIRIMLDQVAAEPSPIGATMIKMFKEKTVN